MDPPPVIARQRLGWRHFVVSAAILLMLAIVSVIVLSPVDTVSVVLPAYEQEFGFTGARVTVQDHRGESLTLYGLITVDPEGPLGAAGFRAGDVPVAYHGGAEEFAWALRRSKCGEATTVAVVQADAWAQHQLRRLTVPARPRSGAPGCGEPWGP
jgi:hypothetical protein